MTQITGALSFAMNTNLYSLFVQDDWQIAPNVKLLYGVRYDLYKYPQGRSDAPLASSQNFNTDKNNWGPRVGVAWSVNPTTVVRASTGIMYDQALLGAYEQALQQTGSPRSPAYTYNGTQAGAPAFPGTVSTGTLGIQSPFTVDPNFEVAHTWQNSVQVERAFGNDFTASASLMYAKGSQLPVINDINLINPIGDAGRRTADLQHRGQREHAGEPGVQPHQRSAVDRRVDVQVAHAADDASASRRG